MRYSKIFPPTNKLRNRAKALVKPIKRFIVDPLTNKTKPSENLYVEPEWFTPNWQQAEDSNRFFEAQINRQVTDGLEFQGDALQEISIMRSTSENLFYTSRAESVKMERNLQKGLKGYAKIAYGAYVQLQYNWTKRQAHMVLNCARDQVVLSRQRGKAALCMQSACTMHDIRQFAPQPVVHLWVTTANRERRRAPRQLKNLHIVPYVVERYAHTLTDGTEKIGASRVTTLKQTLIDMLMYATELEAAVSGDHLLQKMCCETNTEGHKDADLVEYMRARVRDAIESLPATNGKRQALRRLEMLDAKSESVGESITRRLLYEIGFDQPESQVEVIVKNFSHGKHRRYIVDLAVANLGLAIEFDGSIKYVDPKKRWDEKLRDAALYRYFRTIMHLVWTQLKDWHEMVAIFARQLTGLRPAEAQNLAYGAIP